jgi:hypothetical protein
MKSKTINQIGIVIGGEATLSLWGGGTGTIEMEKYFLPNEHVSKDNILRCVNDNGFGCENIDSAEIDIYIKYDNGSTEIERTFYDVHCKHHTHLFLGWAELRRRGIKC